MANQSERSRRWTNESSPRYWWHCLQGNDYIPPIYSDLTEAEWTILREWYEETDKNNQIGECAVPLISFLHGLVMGNRIARILQLGTCSGYSALLLGWMLRRMKAQRGLFSLDIDPVMCETTRRWIERAGLRDFVRIEQRNSLDPVSTLAAREYLAGNPDLIILDSSHDYDSTVAELELWYGNLAPGGVFVLHDVSSFAAEFDTTKKGGVRRAFLEWRKAHPQSETFCLNGNARNMDEPRPPYKDACGLGLIHKPALAPGEK